LILQNSGVENFTVTRAVSIGPLRKTCGFLFPSGIPIATKTCAAFRDAPAHQVYVAFRDMPNAKRPALNTAI